MATNDGEEMSFTRRRIRKQIEEADRERKSKAHKRRMEYAASGALAVKKKNFADAVKFFQGYLKILEEMKGAPPGGLVPSLFDREKEVGELILVSGIYWDMTKIFDRSRTKEQYAEFTRYLEKFQLFSRGMPFEAVCREMLRKYLRNDKPIHSKEFREAYRHMAGTKCFVATSLVDVIGPETLPKLRRFRDRRLRHSAGGRRFIRAYYAFGPSLARGADRLPQVVRFLLGKSLDAAALGLGGAGLK